ncbi:uncharacterized protein LOC135303473 isoform X2 [Passer domesticus]|uniref:uncharacterized protein LOC135303473 isoform X2 n=1 Tax=Passer domesticus TaxID=48849 RepID=UPI0030FE8E44
MAANLDMERKLSIRVIIRFVDLDSQYGTWRRMQDPASQEEFLPGLSGIGMGSPVTIFPAYLKTQASWYPFLFNGAIGHSVILPSCFNTATPALCFWAHKDDNLPAPPALSRSTESYAQGMLLGADISYHQLAMPVYDRENILVARLVGLQTFMNTATNIPGLCDVENCFCTERLQTCSIKGNAQIQLLESHECQDSSQGSS